jgi:alginate O-acetyltransferase complex protein AlgI
MVKRQDAMVFCSEQFFVFFVPIFLVYWALPWQRARTALLLAASFYFYASWKLELALLICASTTIDFFLARGIEASSDPRRRRLLLTINIVGNLGLLCYFKYANFFLDSLRQALQAAGMHTALRPLEILLPVGISFYTFEAINYMVDVYRGKVKAERNLAHFMLFILFFPHLVAGPIVRARDFLPQIGRRKRWSWLRMEIGVRFFLMGLFKKFAIADRMAQFVDPVFADPAAFKTGAIWVAVLAYALQIYCDFSGYTDMALGIAHLLGFHLARNFDMPYLSTNIAEFWRRWHISLSSWLRDYLFIPLGGSRGGTWHTCRNLMITMTLGGLWHGASWTFVAWGVLHGLLLIVHRGVRAVCETRPVLDAALNTLPGMLLRGGLTFLCVSVGWVFFRATTFGDAAEVLRRMFVVAEGRSSALHSMGMWYTLLFVVLCHVVAVTGVWKRASVRLPAPVLGCAYSLALTFALLLAPPMGKAFIYFQF